MRPMSALRAPRFSPTTSAVYGESDPQLGSMGEQELIKGSKISKRGSMILVSEMV